jgi:uncharacterized protein YbbC (DUF1343 family)
MKLLISFFCSLISMATSAQITLSKSLQPQRIVPAAERTSTYIPLLKGKRVGIFANQTSMVGSVHLVDTLIRSGVQVKVIFGPEHGFRGTAEAGQKVGSYVDKQTGISVVSLYGSKHKPSAEDVKDVDVLLFDLQDVGVRFYTYINAMEEFMNAAFELGKPLMVLDRPNPNGFYVDGPVLEKKYRSGVGHHPIPVVYGMTIGEYALMLAGEKWLSPAANTRYEYYKRANNSKDTAFHFQIIKCANYTHNSKYELPVNPSPNLPEMQSIWWYPSTCFFEGTTLSEGRGTAKPFQIFGHPSLPNTMYAFVPEFRDYAKESKPYGKQCYGWNLHDTKEEVLKKVDGKLQIKYLLEAYKLFPDKNNFFIKPKSGNMDDAFFNKLVGNGLLMQQMIAGKSEREIRKSWEPRLNEFKKIRKKYLLYP